MLTVKAPYTGISLNDLRIPAGCRPMGALTHAWRMALELNATAYHFDEDAWQRAGWQDVLSLRVFGEKRERYIKSVRNARNVTRRYLEKRVNTGAERAWTEPEEVEKALVMTHPLPDGKHLVAIAFRGTGGTAREWEPNFACHPTDGMHSGFLRLANEFAEGADNIALSQLGAALGQPDLTLATVEEELTNTSCRFQLLLTGYSQGAAVMQLYAKHLLDRGVWPGRLLGLGFASPSVSYADASDADIPLYHLANPDDLTPRVGAAHHLGQVWQYVPDEALRAQWYQNAYDDPQLAPFRQMVDAMRNLEQALGFCAYLMRAVIGLPTYDLCAFLAGALDPLMETPTTRSAVAQAQVTARVLLFKAASEYRAVFGTLPPETNQEIDILRHILSVGPALYPRLLWRAVALPHVLVRAPEETPASYHDIVVNRLHQLTRVKDI